MGQIKIMTDSTADLPKQMYEELDIFVIPLYVILNDRDAYKEGIEIDRETFYARMRESKILPKTAQPTPNEFIEHYKRLTEDGSSLISIHISGRMSGAVQAARTAASQLPDRDITVIDSMQVSACLGMVVEGAARAAKAGRPKETILALIETLKGWSRVYFIVDSLEYLHKGGRIGAAAHLFGNLLNIKPVLDIKDGLIAPVEKIRGKSKALDRIVQLLGAEVQKHGPMRLFLCHADNPGDLDLWRQKLFPIIPYTTCADIELGCVVGVHAGPGTMAVFFIPEYEV
jgi:DegV family protein with EDD domain